MAQAVPPVTPPVSLGVLPKDDTAGVSMKPAFASRFTRGTTPAVIDEPFGGSPKGTAIGPVVAAAVIDERSLRRPAERNGRNAT